MLCAALAVLVALAAAAPAGAVRSNRGAKPSVTLLTKDQRTALRTAKLSLRVGVGIAPARVRLRGLGLDLGPRPMRIVKERKVRFRRAHSRVYNLKLTPAARRLIQAARDACRDVRISAFASARRYGRHRDDRRTTLVRHSKTLKHGRRCATPGTPGAPGVPGTPGATPGQGGPGLGSPGSPTPPPPPLPNDPITIRAGAADADSTPPVGTPMFAYTARSLVFGPDPNHALQIIADPDENLYAKTFVPSQGIHTRLRARAVVIEAGGKKFALAMVDLGGHPYSFNQAVAERIAATGVTADRLFLSSTHTHASSGAIWSADNSGYAFVGGDAYDPRVFDMIVSGVVEAITEANKNLQPARVGVGTSQLFGASSNREHEAFRRNPDAPADQKASRGRAIDPQVTVIRVDDARGAPLAAWSNFAIHPTSLGDENLLFSGDNVATAERLTEEEMLRDATAQGRAPARRPVNVWTNGTEGDITENDDVDRDPDLPPDDAHSPLQHSTGGFAGANSSGRKVSAGIIAAWRDAGTRMSGSPAVDARRTFMDFDGSDGSSSIPVLGAGGIVGGEGEGPQPDGGCEIAPNPIPNQSPKQFLFGGPGIAPNVFPVSLMRIGPLAVAAFPTEVATVAGRRIRNDITAIAGGQAPAGTIIAGLTNAYNSYLATPEEYDECTYFGSFTLWGRNQLGVYRRVGQNLANALFRNQPLASAAEPSAVSPGTPNQPSVRPTPDAGDVVTQPADNVNRLRQAVFKFQGGDPAIDAPRGKSFVTLEYRPGTSGPFRPVATEDSVMDTTQHAADDSWTETWQFTECDALGQYRFVARGRAVTDGPASDYTATSEPFTLRTASIKSYSTTVSGGMARVRAEYEGLPNPALATLAKRVRHGFAVLRVTKPGGEVEEVIAPIDSRGLEFRAGVPDGSSVSVVSIEDACGNTGR
jgi:neutral ceramidase